MPIAVSPSMLAFSRLRSLSGVLEGEVADGGHEPVFISIWSAGGGTGTPWRCGHAALDGFTRSCTCSTSEASWNCSLRRSSTSAAILSERT
ncbi:MAG: hypothetical protein ACLR7Z_01310 [Bilophila wadsworthia]